MGVAAKRAAPRPVPPLVHAGVRYLFPHFTEGGGPHGGVVEARDERTGALLWTLRACAARPVPGLEQDAQDLFLTWARIEGAALVVGDERGEVHEIDLATRRVRRR